MGGESFAQARRLRRLPDPAVDGLGRHPEVGRTRIAAELPEFVQGSHGPAGEGNDLPLTGLGC